MLRVFGWLALLARSDRAKDGSAALLEFAGSPLARKYPAAAAVWER